MSSSAGSQESGCSSPARYQQDTLHLQTANISSNLQLIPSNKLTDLCFINTGAYGTVHKAFHSDWRISVAVKFFPKERHLGESDRSKILKEAEILHKARFSYILPILGICYELDTIAIVTEYMANGSLNQLLHEENPALEIVWPLRFRILYEIALGVNFLHNLIPPLLHHDLKTQNILLDNEFHVKIADFGLSKWRMLSQSLSDHKPAGGTIIYMPPEMYELNDNTARGSIKHDMYSYAIIMWEVLSRKQPYEGVPNPMVIMFNVNKGNRPDTSEENIPADMPSRDVFLSLIQSGWASNPNDRPSFLKCLLDLEPVIRTYDDISILEGILQIKRAKCNYPQDWRTSSNVSVSPLSTGKMSASYPGQRRSSEGFGGKQLPTPETGREEISWTPNPGLNEPWPLDTAHPVGGSTPESPAIGLNEPWLPPLDTARPVCGCTPGSPAIGLNEPWLPPESPVCGPTPESPAIGNEKQEPPPYTPPHTPTTAMANLLADPQELRPQQDSRLALRWILSKRDQIVNHMTDACLNQCLDALIANMIILKEDYELIRSERTRSAKVRRLIDTCDMQGELFARIIMHKLKDNRITDLQPFPEVSQDF